MTKTRLSFIEDTDSNYVQKPFVEKYVQAGLGEEGEEHEVISVEEAKSGTGYKLETKDFVVFLRKNSTVLQYLLEALGMWVKDSDNPALVVVLTEKSPYYRLAANNEAKRAWTERGGKYIVQDKSTGATRKAGNPFLTARYTPPVTSIAHDAHEGYPGQEEEEPPKRSKRGS
jgi:hypothetical protein